MLLGQVNDAWTPSEKYPWARLWTIDVESREARQLTRGDLHVAGFSFSPDGQRIAFAGQPTPLIPDQYNSDLYVVSSAGGEPKLLVQRPGADAAPDWSPDGKWIAFLSQDGKSPEWFTSNYVCIVSPDAAALRSLAPRLELDRLGGPGRLAWSPDSTSLLVASLQRTASQVLRITLTGKVMAALQNNPRD